jgi:hypothetical protein
VSNFSSYIDGDYVWISSRIRYQSVIVEGIEVQVSSAPSVSVRERQLIELVDFSIERINSYLNISKIAGI